MQYIWCVTIYMIPSVVFDLASSYTHEVCTSSSTSSKDYIYNFEVACPVTLHHW